MDLINTNSISSVWQLYNKYKLYTFSSLFYGFFYPNKFAKLLFDWLFRIINKPQMTDSWWKADLSMECYKFGCTYCDLCENIGTQIISDKKNKFKDTDLQYFSRHSFLLTT